jgi:hypothetical protein
VVDETPDPIRAELGARLRAGFWLYGQGPKDVAEALTISTSVVHRVYRGSTEAHRGQYDQMRKLALSLGVPGWFLDHGWDGANVPDEVGIAEEVQALRNQMDTVLAIIANRSAAGAALAGPPPTQPEDLGDETATDRKP